MCSFLLEHSTQMTLLESHTLNLYFQLFGIVWYIVSIHRAHPAVLMLLMTMTV